MRIIGRYPGSVGVSRGSFDDFLKSYKFGGLLLVAILIAFTVAYMQRVSALTSTLVPVADISTGWTVPSSGTTHYALVDEGTTPTDTDYVSTGTSTAGGEIEEFALDNNTTGIDQASQIVVTARLRSITMGSNADTVGIALRVNGALTAVQTFTMTTTITNYTATFNGTWNQSDVDSMQVYLIRNVLGSGNPTGQRDNVALYNLYGTLTYTPPPSIEQSAYRWFTNQDTSSATTFLKAVGGASDEKGYSIDQTTDGGYVMTGLTTGFGSGSNDTLITKYDAAANVRFTRVWGGSGLDQGQSVTATSDGGFAVAGYTASYGAGGEDAFIARFTSTGALSWSKTWGGASTDRAYSIDATSDGGFIIAGTTVSYGAGGEDAWMAKLSSSGALEWSRVVGGTGTDYVRSVKQTVDGGYVAAGYTSSYGNGTTNAYIIRYNSLGGFMWARTWGGTGSDYAYGVTNTSDGGFAITGTGSSYKATGAANTDEVFLAKFSPNGTLSWSRTWGSSNNDYGRMVVEAADGGLVITGSGFSTGNFDGFLAKFTSTGTLSWSSQAGNSGIDNSYSVVATEDGGFAQAIEAQSWGAGTQDAVIAKWDSSGAISGCSTNCNSQTISTSSPAVTTTVPSPATSSPSVALGSPTAGSGIISPTHTTVVATTPTSVGVGAALAGNNTSITAPGSGAGFRLRMNLHPSGGALNPGNNIFKLQYADKGGAASCSAVGSGNFADVTQSTPIRYFNNQNATSSLSLASDANDPTHGADTLVRQQYLEASANTFTNSTVAAAGQDAMWDFALTMSNSAPGGKTYCLRIVTALGSLLDTYGVFPEISTTQPTADQVGSRWYQNSTESAKTFLKASGETSLDEYYDVTNTSDGGYVAVGQDSWAGALLVKYDSSGDISWTRHVSGPSYEDYYSVIQTSDGGYLAAGDTGSFGAGSRDGFIVKYDSSGALSWNRTAGGADLDQFNSVIQTSDGGYLAVGDTASFGAGGTDGFIVKYDSSGALSWSRTAGGTNADGFKSVIQTSDGGYLVAGVTASSGAGGWDGFIVKYDSSGALSWSRTAGGAGTDEFIDVIQTSDSGYLAAGEASDLGIGDSDGFIVKYDSSGALSWSRTAGGTGADEFKSVIQTSDGGYFAAGSTSSFGAGNGDGFIVKYDSSGALSWSRTAGGSSTDRYADVIQAADGGFLVAGATLSYGSGNYDGLMAKYDASGAISGCGGSVCTSPVIVSDSTAPSVASPTPATASPVPTTSSPASTTSAPTLTVTTIVATATFPDIGVPLATQNSSITAPSPGAPVRLRILLQISSSALGVSGASYKLQYASKSGVCSSALTYSDVTNASAIKYYDNTGYSNGAVIAPSVTDPGGSGSTVHQTYIESNPFSNTTSLIGTGDSGLWDIALTTDASASGDYCLRIVHANGSVLSAYSNYPSLTVAGGGGAPTLSQMLRGGQSVIDGIKNAFSW